MLALFLGINIQAHLNAQGVAVTGELKRWHRVALTFDGPSACEDDAYNPFLNYTLDVTFTNGPDTFTVPGFFAADGNALESGATCGNKWRVYFTPQRMGTWNYTVSFRQGGNIAAGAWAGTPAAFDGTSGSFDIAPTDKSGRDFRYHGRLTYRNHRYMRFAGSMEWYLMSGAGSPENFLAYEDFDGTFNNGGTNYVKSYSPHLGDWNPGDPTWQGGKGKGIIGAVNYLASQGVNAAYLLTFNEQGDGDDVWPFTQPGIHNRMDVSKLDQWELVFGYMDQQGIVKHFLLQETENDQLIDGGALGPDRKVYYREMVARFSHHLGIIWNLGEENTNSDAQRKSHATYLRNLDPYNHLIQVHTYPWEKDVVFTPLLGYEDYEGASLQVSSGSFADDDTKKWVQESADAGRQWVVFLSEIGPASVGVKPDDVDPEHTAVRKDFLWPHLMHQGSGVEWYFGYSYAHNDLNCEDFRSRQNIFQQTDHALELLRKGPFQRMEQRHDLVDRWGTTCLAMPGKYYVVHMPFGDYTNLYLDEPGFYKLGFYDPRNGGDFVEIREFDITTPGNYFIDDLPTDQDWVACVLKVDTSTASLRVADLFAQGGASMGQGHAYPNPTLGLTTVRFAHNSLHDQREFVLQAADGREVRRMPASAQTLNLDLGDVAEGLYLWKLTVAGRPMEQGRIVRARQ
jgi:hypothetical protein